MRKDRILERDHRDYVKAERDVLTAVVHPYIVTLRYSFQVCVCVCLRGGRDAGPPALARAHPAPRLALCRLLHALPGAPARPPACGQARAVPCGRFPPVSLETRPPLASPTATSDPQEALPRARFHQRRPPVLPGGAQAAEETARLPGRAAEGSVHLACRRAARQAPGGTRCYAPCPSPQALPPLLSFCAPQLYRQGTFDEALARLYCAEIVLAIAHLHSLGFVHRLAVGSEERRGRGSG